MNDFDKTADNSVSAWWNTWVGRRNRRKFAERKGFSTFEIDSLVATDWRDVPPEWKHRLLTHNSTAMNNNCGGSGPHTPGEVRVMPSGGDSNLILCRSCWRRELEYRRDRNPYLAQFARYDLPTWESAKVYEG